MSSEQPTDGIVDIDDDNVAFYAEGYSEEVNQRASDCTHSIFRWQLFDADTDEWRKECCSCPAVLRQEFSEAFPG